MKRILILTALLSTTQACSSCDPTPECEGVTCANGACDPDTGTCDCTGGWTGDLCDACPQGQHEGASGDCTANPCDPNTCSGPNKAVCTANGPTATCSCNGGFHDESGTCVIDEECQTNSCSGHGTCADATGVIVCACAEGYAGGHCENCAQNYQDKNSDGTCAKACTHPTLGLNCNGHGQCDDDSGTAACACHFNWQDANCATCPVGSYVNEFGDCMDDPCIPEACSGHGSCSNAMGGVAVCTCSDNWTGADCNSCPSGSYINGGGDCVDDPCLPDPCNGNGSCTKPSGTAVCDCDNQWSQADNCLTCPSNWDSAQDCNVCAGGYGGTNCIPNPTASNLAVDCSTTGNDCGSQGLIYPATFSYTNVTSCAASVSVVSGSGTSGSVSTVALSGGVGSFNYTTGSDAGDEVEIVVVCTNDSNPNTATTTKVVRLQ